MRTLAGLSIAFLTLAGGELLASWLGRPTLLVETAARIVTLQSWILEAVAFVAVARLLVGRAGVVLDGMIVGAVLWVVRWPLLALSLQQLGASARIDWPTMVRDRLVLDLLLGLVLAWVFRRVREETA